MDWIAMDWIEINRIEMDWNGMEWAYWAQGPLGPGPNYIISYYIVYNIYIYIWGEGGAINWRCGLSKSMQLAASFQGGVCGCAARAALAALI